MNSSRTPTKEQTGEASRPQTTANHLLLVTLQIGNMSADKPVASAEASGSDAADLAKVFVQQVDTT